MEWIEDIKNAYDSLLLQEVFNCKQDVLIKFKEQVLGNIDSNSEDDYPSRCERIVELGIACLQMFVAENWTGPAVRDEEIPEKLKVLFSEEFTELVSYDLQSDGEVIHALCRKAGLFWIAHFILVEIADRFTSFKKSKLWTLRCLTVYQELLEEKSSMLNEKFLSVVEANEDVPSVMDREADAQFHLECAHLYLQYYGYSKAKEHLERARNILGLEISLIGALGKRTKFQQNELAQLRLEVKLTEKEERNATSTSSYQSDDLPTDAVLDDDTLLSKVNYADASDLPFLKPIDQAFILTASILLQKTTPKDNLLLEELLPYIQAVTQNPLSWAVQFKALHMRSLLESKGKRTVERSMLQMQHLVDEFTKGKPAADKRLYLLHSVAVPPHWILQANFARILISLGCTKSALEIFEKIQSWEDVIACYRNLGRHEKAENVIRQQLEIKETAKLWCLLADVTENIEFYEKAWELSKHRSARAQRSLGFWYLRTGKFQECIPYFQKSLEISSLQINYMTGKGDGISLALAYLNRFIALALFKIEKETHYLDSIQAKPQVWFSLGCAGIATTQFDIARTAFQRYVTIDPDNHEAWNNLSTVFIKTNQKRKAFRALQEALKANYSSWQIWENFLLVAVDLGEFKDTIRAMHTLLELKKKQVDIEVLRILVQSATSDVKDAVGEPASNLIPKIKELLGKMTSQITNNPEIWHLYGDLYFHISEPDSNEKALNFFMKAHRCYVQNAVWEKDTSRINNVTETYMKLIQVTQKMKTDPESNGCEHRVISSTRMAVSNFLKRFHVVYPDGLSNESDLKSKENLEILRKDIEEL